MQAPEPGPVKAAGSVQDIDHTRPTGDAGASVLNTVLQWGVAAEVDHPPKYWSRSRDDWMADWLKTEGNDLLAGAHSTLVAKIAATDWYVEGPMALASLYRDILLNKIGFGAGWHSEISMWTDAYLTRDFGGTLECLRSSRTDYTGPALGFAHMDEGKCLPTGTPEWPIIYYNSEKGPIPLHQSQVCWITDTPDPRDQYRGVGYSSASRTWSTSAIMSQLVTYKRESLSDLPPAGILMISNMTSTQWADIETRYDARMQNQGNTTWRDVLVAFSLDPAYPLNAEYIQMSKLWEHFDERTATDIAVFSFALGYRVDAREFWPVSSGALGTAMEAEIQHRKAKAKGEGIIFQAIERQLNGPNRLPSGLSFRFDYRDTEEDQMAAHIRELNIQNVRRLWEASPNRVTAGSTLPPGEDGGSESGGDMPPPQEQEAGPELTEEDAESRLGIISTEEARALLVHWGVVPPEILGQTLEVGRLYDVKSAEMYGPTVRAHSDGRMTLMKRHMTPGEARAWQEYYTGR